MSVPPGVRTQRSRAVEDLAADDVEHHVNFANIFQPVRLQVQEGMHSLIQGPLRAGSPVQCQSRWLQLRGQAAP